MRTFSLGELKAGINRSLDDTAHPILRAGLLGAYGADDWPRIRECLNDWQKEGILKILADPEGLPSATPCVVMLKFIHRRSSIPGFLNWDEDPPHPGLSLPATFSGIHPVLYHYTDESALAFIRIEHRRRLILDSKPDDSFTYWTSEKVDDESDPGPLLQSPGPPRTLRLETSVVDQSEGILIPPAFDTRSHSYKPWLEIMTRDNPHHGPGGIPQFVTRDNRIVNVWDRTFRKYLTADDLE